LWQDRQLSSCGSRGQQQNEIKHRDFVMEGFYRHWGFPRTREKRDGEHVGHVTWMTAS
jgi:hypothetical protein